MGMTLKEIVSGMPNPILKGCRQFTLEELTIKLASLEIFSDDQITEFVQSANSRCVPPFTTNRVSRIVKKELIYFRSESFSRYKPKIKWYNEH
jgi:hypothetical protein